MRTDADVSYNRRVAESLQQAVLWVDMRHRNVLHFLASQQGVNNRNMTAFRYRLAGLGGSGRWLR